LVWRDVQHTLTSFHSSKFTAVLAGALLFALIDFHLCNRSCMVRLKGNKLILQSNNNCSVSAYLVCLGAVCLFLVFNSIIKLLLLLIYWL
jgi:hypothetical protein